MVNGSSLSKLNKRFSTNGSIIETGTDSKQINRLPQHYIQMMPHMTDPGEYSDSPSKAFRGNARIESAEIDQLQNHTHTPTKMPTSYNVVGDPILQQYPAHID